MAHHIEPQSRMTAPPNCHANTIWPIARDICETVWVRTARARTRPMETLSDLRPAEWHRASE
eukprot:8966108-Pyramimonas_sp.AAC.1